jgi:hypothetical protein
MSDAKRGVGCSVALAAAAALSPLPARGAGLVPRWGHAAVQLSSGDVVVTGGVHDGAGGRSCERWRAAARRWESCGRMAHGRNRHAAVVLGADSVLVAGGRDDAQQMALASVELLNMGTGTWRSLPDLATARAAAFAARLASGEVIVGGGEGGSMHFAERLASSEIWRDGATAWRSGPELPSSEDWPTVLALADGGVVHAGLHGVVTLTGKAKTWAPAGALHAPRRGGAAVQLADGRIMVAGGLTASKGGDGGKELATVELGDAHGSAWTTVAPMAIPRANLALVDLGDGRVIALGGTRDGKALASTEVFDVRAGTWREGPKLATARWGAEVFRVGEHEVLLVGGEAATGDELLPVPAAR